MNQKLITASAVALASAVAGAAPARATTTKLPCASPGRVVAADSQTVLTRKGGSHFAPDYGYNVCTRGHRARSLEDVDAGLIERYSSPENYLPVSINRGRVAWVLNYPGERGTSISYSTLNTLNLRTGKKVTTRSSATTIALRSDGAVYWSSYDSPTPGLRLYSIHERTPNGQDRVLDSGAILAQSLTVTRQSVTWVKDGVLQGLRLPFLP